MKTMLTLILVLFSLSAFSQSSYYPEEVLRVIEQDSSSKKLLKETLFSLLDKVHLQHESGNDTLVDECPLDGKCMQQVRNMSYKRARELMFGNLFLERLSNNQYAVKDVYCNKVITKTDGVGPGAIPNPNVINCEHTWPQSKFSKQFPSGMQKSDLHHLYPTDMKANSTRSNHPFGEVRGQVVNNNCQDSKVGAELTTSVRSFEPPAEHRGNVARAIYYFSIRYKMDLDPVQANYLKKWNEEDPVDLEERERNDKIMELQGNRNPFIDYPELIKRL